MSVSIILVPIALAAVAAWHAAQTEEQDGHLVCHVATRMRDPQLLTAALTDTGASVETAEGEVVARWHGVDAVFRRDEQGIWSVHLTGETDEEQALDIVTAIDAAYGRQVQRAVLARLKARAPDAGLEVTSETKQGDDITLVLTVAAGA